MSVRIGVVVFPGSNRDIDAVNALERRLFVPQDDRFGTGEVERVDRVAVAVAPREDDDPDADRHP